jgi:hypothetical protein
MSARWLPANTHFQSKRGANEALPQLDLSRIRRSLAAHVSPRHAPSTAPQARKLVATHKHRLRVGPCSRPHAAADAAVSHAACRTLALACNAAHTFSPYRIAAEVDLVFR